MNSQPTNVELTIADLTVGYGSRMVLSISDEVLFGPRLVALLGSNGAGKTTLLQVLGGLTVPKTGTVTLNGDNVQNGAVRAKIAFVPDRPVLFDDISLGDTRRHVLTLARSAVPDPLGADLWGGFELENLRKCFPFELSRGQRQKATLAIGLSRPANLVLLDEPTIALDDNARAVLANALEAAAKRTLILFATHDEELASNANLTYRLEDGQLEQGNQFEEQ
ncbi:MAG: ATP-binding cassette domain-containing protein [Acidimicrobiia bacterium]|nr:ATP-binding cassette domain-containing protein [Acidimicrobiia bacterium]